MPNQRRAGQTFVGFQSDDDLIVSLDNARGHDSRSLFVRKAVAEKLRSLGIAVDDALIFPPDRAARLADDGKSKMPKTKKLSPAAYKKSVTEMQRRSKKLP